MTRQDIRWFRLSELPTLKKGQQQGSGEDLVKGNKFFMVAPFLGPLKRWIREHRKQVRRAPSATYSAAEVSDARADIEEALPVEEGAAEAETSAGHLNQLLEGLRNPRQVSEESPLQEAREASLPASHASDQVNDPVAELKRILNVKKSDLTPSTSGQSQPSHSDNLLAILRSGSEPSLKPPEIDTFESGSHPPRTPFEQVLPPPNQPRTPHHEQPRPPAPIDSRPPPAFPYSPARVIQAQHVQHHHPQVLPGHATTWQHHPGSLPQSLPKPSFPHQQAHQSNPAMHGPTTPQYSQTMPKPFHHLGNQHFTHTYKLPNMHGPVVPPPSKLPVPRLNEHTSALLNAFKTPRALLTPVSSTVTPVQAETSSARSTHLTDQPAALTTKPIVTGAPPPGLFDSEPATSGNPRVMQPSSPQVSTQAVPAETVPTRGLPGTVHEASRPRSAHQHALLKLFQPPSPSTSQEIPQKGSSMSSAREPVGLPTKFSGGISPEGMPSAKPVVGRAPPHRSHTVGPSTAPAQVRTKRPVMVPPQVQSRTPTAGDPPQMQVRPALTHPQTLARPAARVSAFDRRENVGSDQKYALLSLFAKPTVQQPPASAAATAAAPAFANPMSALSLNTSIRDAGPLPSSNVAEQATAVPPEPVSMTAARLNSIGSLVDVAPAAKSGSGPQTLTTSADRSAFLLNYLEDVVRSSRK